MFTAVPPKIFVFRKEIRRNIYADIKTNTCVKWREIDVLGALVSVPNIYIYIFYIRT